jgi:ABC-type antimicrobial peptide transport system permease subunit
MEKIIFFSVIGVLGALYLAIYVASVVSEISHEGEERKTPEDGPNYCEGIRFIYSEVWYLVLNVICVVLSIIVVIVMFKIQND